MARAIPTRSATRRTRAALFAVSALVVVFLAGPLAGTAGAHASVIEVRPGPAEVLEESPRTVEVWFTSGVDVRLGGLFVYDGHGDRVATGRLRQPTPDHLVVPITEDLDDGSYIVTYRTVSEEDSHTMQGTWTFRVGDASAATADVETVAADILAGQRADRVVAIGWGIARGTVFASMALLVGGVVFAAVIWPRARDARATRRIIGAGWIGLAASTLVGVLLFGAYTRGGGLVDALDPDVVGDTLDIRLGKVWVVRLVVLALVLPLLRVLFARRPAADQPLPSWWAPVATVLGAVLVSTPAFAGHASAGDHTAFALVADALHVAAMAVWLGGLVVLGAVVLRDADVDAIRRASRRFSRVALACVIALVVTGGFQTWRVIGGLDALRDAEYGRILVVKLVAVAAMLVVATFSREITQRVLRVPAVPTVRGGALDLADPDVTLPPPETPDDAGERARLRRSVWGEVAIGALVLVLSALLVNAAPPADADGRDPATTVTIEDRQVTLVVSATPGAAGFNDVRVNVYSPDGSPLDAMTVELTMALPARDVAPLAVPLRELGPGNYLSPGIDIPLAGTWALRATIRLGPVDRVDVTGALEIPLMDHVDTANTFFTLLTLLANAAVVAAVALALAALVSRPARAFAAQVVDQVGPSARALAWFVATVATLGSLYYSEIADFVPCRLCWFQRICMYPLAAILLVGLLLRDRRARWYAAPFVVVGAPISLYHWLIERGVFWESSSCSATVPCAVPWFEELGYVTLAFMALSGFLLIGTLLVVDAIWDRRTATVDALPESVPSPDDPVAARPGTMGTPTDDQHHRRDEVST